MEHQNKLKKNIPIYKIVDIFVNLCYNVYKYKGKLYSYYTAHSYLKIWKGVIKNDKKRISKIFIIKKR